MCVYFISILCIHTHVQTFFPSFSLSLYFVVIRYTCIDVQVVPSRCINRLTWPQYVQCYSIVVDKGAMAVREIQLSERGLTYISASETRQSASFPRDSDSGRPCQALMHTPMHYAAKISRCNNLKHYRATRQGGGRFAATLRPNLSTRYITGASVTRYRNRDS
jgi:hypothetical protein